MINLLLVEDHPILRTGLKVVLEQMLDVRVKGEAGNGKEAIKLIEQQTFDLVMMDIDLPGVDGVDVAKIIKQRRPKQKILIYSAREENNIIAKAIRVGVSGYVFKSDDANELKTAVETVMRNENYLSRRISDSFIPFLIERVREKQSSNKTFKLSEREKEIISLSLGGMRKNEMTKALLLTSKNLDNHCTNLKKKLRCSNLNTLFNYAIEKQIV